MEIRTGKNILHIRETVIQMASLVETAVQNGIDSFLTSDPSKAEIVIGNDSAINAIEMDIDSLSVDCLVLNAPVAGDFRLLFCIQKMNKDLERIGDHAVNISESAITCSGYSNPFEKATIKLMAAHVTTMLHDAIVCFTNADPQLALKVLEHDDRVDEMNRLISRKVIDMVKSDIAHVEILLELLRVSKNLERIADLSTNIAEDVIFFIKALDIKHHHLHE